MVSSANLALLPELAALTMSGFLAEDVFELTARESADLMGFFCGVYVHLWLALTSNAGGSSVFECWATCISLI